MECKQFNEMGGYNMFYDQFTSIDAIDNTLHDQFTDIDIDNMFRDQPTEIPINNMIINQPNEIPINNMISNPSTEIPINNMISNPSTEMDKFIKTQNRIHSLEISAKSLKASALCADVSRSCALREMNNGKESKEIYAAICVNVSELYEKARVAKVLYNNAFN
jgi:hypothetical protein